MFGIGTQELLIVLGIIVLLFGARKLPELARGVGSSMKEFKRGLAEVEKDIQETGSDGEVQ